MMRVLLVVAALICSLRVAGAEVVVATEKDFDTIITRGEIALVKFYAPWCGHCKKLAPEWEKAAKEVPGEAIMVDVDCTTEKKLAEKYSIKGYPTIIMFRDGEEVEKYSGARQSDAIVKYVKDNVGPALTQVSDAQSIQDMKKEHATMCVGVTSSLDSTLSKVLLDCAKSLRMMMKFVVVTDPKILPDEKPEGVVVYRGNGEKEVYDGEMEISKLKVFLEKASVPFAGEITPESYTKYAQLKHPVGWVLLEPSTESFPQFVENLVELGRKVRPHMVLLWVDVEKHNVAKALKIPEDSKYPAFVIVHQGKNYILPTSEPATLETIEKFIVEHSLGNVAAELESQPVPDVETVDGLTTIVGKTFDKYLSSGKDILIEFFAPWCGHCKKLAPIYAKVAKEFESSDVIIAAMDATANHVDSSVYDVSGYPTVYFIPHGKKPILFDGDRTFLGLYKFVREHSTAFGSEKDEHAKEDVAGNGEESGVDGGDL